MYEGLFSFGFSFVWKLFYPALECFFNIYSIPTRNVYKLFEWSQVSDITLAANRASTKKLLSITTFWCFLIEKYFNKNFQFDKESKLCIILCTSVKARMTSITQICRTIHSIEPKAGQAKSGMLSIFKTYFHSCVLAWSTSFKMKRAQEKTLALPENIHGICDASVHIRIQSFKVGRQSVF